MKPLLVLGLVIAGLGLGHSAAAVSDTPNTAWGESNSGIELGVRLTGEARPYKIGEVVEVEVHLRNEGNSAVTCSIPHDLTPGGGNVPHVADEQGKPLRVRSVIYLGSIALLPQQLDPGKSKILGKMRILLCKPGRDQPAAQELRLGAPAGKYRLTQLESVWMKGPEASYFRLESGPVSFQVATPS